MKAIIITFHGEAPENNYDEIIRRMAELVFNNTSAKIEDISAAVLDDKEAVSYTHLDVYKRQHLLVSFNPL